MKTNEPAIAKIDYINGHECTAYVIVNGATEVVKETLSVDVTAHIETESHYDDVAQVIVQTSYQVGEGGYKPFIDKLKELYPNVTIIDSTYFDTIVEMQKEQASALGF